MPPVRGKAEGRGNILPPLFVKTDCLSMKRGCARFGERRCFAVGIPIDSGHDQPPNPAGPRPRPNAVPICAFMPSRP